jgi:hypothetical protein
MDNKEITAEWARKQAISILGERVKKEIDICLNAIKSAVEKNQMSVSVSIYVHELTEADLTQRGFKVKRYNDQRDGSYVSISW